MYNCTILARLSLLRDYYKCKERKRGQDLKTIVQSLYSLELFLSLSIASIELFVILGLSKLSNRQIVC